jgi:hypothetical protein
MAAPCGLPSYANAPVTVTSGVAARTVIVAVAFAFAYFGSLLVKATATEYVPALSGACDPPG